jgi:hypothetical protein
MLTVKEALERIDTQFAELFGPDIRDVRLEELKKSRKSNYDVTVSFLRPDENVPAMFASTLGKYSRQYKRVLLDKENGSIVSVTMCQDA